MPVEASGRDVPFCGGGGGGGGGDDDAGFDRSGIWPVWHRAAVHTVSCILKLSHPEIWNDW